MATEIRANDNALSRVTSNPSIVTKNKKKARTMIILEYDGHFSPQNENPELIDLTDAFAWFTVLSKSIESETSAYLWMWPSKSVHKLRFKAIPCYGMFLSLMKFCGYFLNLFLGCVDDWRLCMRSIICYGACRNWLIRTKKPIWLRMLLQVSTKQCFWKKLILFISTNMTEDSSVKTLPSSCI